VLLSTDPAHSLGDVLGVKLSPALTRIRIPASARRARSRTRGTLRAAELDAPRSFARWLNANRRGLGEALEHGTWLDRSDIDALLALPLPGIDELMALLDIVRLGRDIAPAPDQPAHVVVDTAPTGHTLRLLAAPETVAGASEALDALQEEHRQVRQQLARVSRPEAADRLIETLAHQASEAAGLLAGTSSAFRWVTLAEPLALDETVDGIAALRTAGVRIEEIVVNRVIPGGPACRVCDRLRRDQRDVIARLRRGVGAQLPVRLLQAAATEPRGLEPLVRVGVSLIDRRMVAGALPRARVLRARPVRGRCVYSSSGTGDVLPESLVASSTRLVLVGGKGGVGKTTVAATIAMRLARADAKRRVLLMSTDPAHSIGDVLGEPIRDTAAAVRGAPANVRAREVDAASLLVARRIDVQRAVDEIAAATGAAGDQAVDDLMRLAPPGIDEVLAMVEVARLLDHDELGEQVIIVDMAPTGHALRLLQMPAAAHEWVRVLMRMLLKYRAVVRPGGLAADLVELSRSIGRLQEILRDPRRTRVVAVTRAADVPLRETERLFHALKRLRIPAPVLVVNAVTLAPASCPRCGAVASAERRMRSRIVRIAGRVKPSVSIVAGPLAAPPPRGAKELERWGVEWTRI